MTTEIAPEVEAVNRISESIRNADIPVSEQTHSDPTPTEAKPAEEQAAEGGKAGNNKVKPDSTGESAPKEGEAAKAETPDDKKEGEGDSAKADPNKNPFGLPEEELADMLGIPKPEQETVESLRVKYANSSREAHRLVEMDKARQEFFKSQGLTLVQDEEGKFALVPDEEYEKKFDLSKDLNIKKMYDNLSEEDKENLIAEPEKVIEKIGKQVALELLAKRPPVTNKRIETRISDEQANSVWSGFVASKLQDGKTPRYPDADSQAVVETMKRILSSETPAMEKFKKVINSDPDLHYIGLEHLYLKTRNVMLESKIRQLLSQNQKQEKKSELENKVSASAGTQMPTQAQVQSADQDPAERIARAIREA